MDDDGIPVPVPKVGIGNEDLAEEEFAPVGANGFTIPADFDDPKH